MTKKTHISPRQVHDSLRKHVQVDGYDIGRLENEIEYRDNEVNLDATSLPVPMPADPGEAIDPT